MTVTVREKNRNIRKEALREWLSKQKLAQQVVEIAKKLNDETLELNSTDIQRLKASADINFKLLNKYIPDAKDPAEVNVNATVKRDASQLSDDELATIAGGGSLIASEATDRETQLH